MRKKNPQQYGETFIFHGGRLILCALRSPWFMTTLNLLITIPIEAVFIVYPSIASSQTILPLFETSFSLSRYPLNIKLIDLILSELAKFQEYNL